MDHADVPDAKARERENLKTGAKPLIARGGTSARSRAGRLALLIILAASCGIFMPAGCSQSSSPPDPEPAPPSPASPIVIHYAANESHSNSWVRRADSGMVGIVYGRYAEDQDKHDADKTGELMYRTVMPDGSEKEEAVATGRGVDKCVLVYDADGRPHIFFAVSDDAGQTIFHLHKDVGEGWLKETTIQFAGEGGRFIYELSADIGKSNAVHLLVLIVRSNPDSNDFMNCYRNSSLFHVSNRSGNWQKELIHRYDTFFTYDMHVKTQRRQDIAVDGDGYVHVVFGEQRAVRPPDYENTHAVLHYATNRSSAWVREIALQSAAETDDAGWYPSLCLDRAGRPAIASTYLARVPTHSVHYAQLCYSVRLGEGNWQTAVVAEEDDGYHGTDGRNYTGALPHLRIDSANRPHIVFSDIASSHNPQNVLCTGQIRYAVFSGNSWELSTIYRQPPPSGFFQCAEMAGQCLAISGDGNRIQVVGQEMVSTAKDVYTCRLLRLDIR